MDPSHDHEQEEAFQLNIETKNSIIWRVRSGFYTCDEIVASTAESIADETQGITPQRASRAVRAVVAAEWAAQLERQQAWPPDESTISEKLANAFSSLERNHKILARMNFTCCQTCGAQALSEDRDDDSRGYVFFHEQHTEGVVASSGLGGSGGGVLPLVYGSFTRSEKKTHEVGDIIVKSLRRAGLRPEWTRETGRVIKVRCDEWRRRLEGDEDLEDVADDDFDPDCVMMSSSESELEPEPDTVSDLDLADELDIRGSFGSDLEVG